ncbi:MarR family winged helix-turn-helix transcriptional regulator [Mycolicibacterium komossense]|uniref:MarR family winged helix-turn-helix transcriptional regulator n=1 Tax=Mycolicibacterium komossense TaxID=1779 RepID=UPI0021F2B31B|nr:MarR family winged helix-turn-helix transcriptional regulator [Mycolicibacterium komossense]
MADDVGPLGRSGQHGKVPAAGKLVGRGLVTPTTDPHDRRPVRLRLTTKAKNHKRDIDVAWASAVGQQLSTMTVADVSIPTKAAPLLKQLGTMTQRCCSITLELSKAHPNRILASMFTC